jgi:hypothetical protein
VLTSKRTFSGAEEFAFDLKNQKRATVVGEPNYAMRCGSPTSCFDADYFSGPINARNFSPNVLTSHWFTISASSESLPRAA